METTTEVEFIPENAMRLKAENKSATSKSFLRMAVLFFLGGIGSYHATKLVWGGCGDHFRSREPCDPLFQLPCLEWIHTEEPIDLFVQNQSNRENRKDLLEQRRKDHTSDTKVSSRGNKARFERSGSRRAHRFTRLYGLQGCPFDLK